MGVQIGQFSKKLLQVSVMVALQHRKKCIIRYSLMEFINMVSVPQGVNDSPIRSLGESTLAVESDLPKDRLRAG